MKLISCPHCGDLQCLINLQGLDKFTRTCFCGKVAGKYLPWPAYSRTEQ